MYGKARWTCLLFLARLFSGPAYAATLLVPGQYLTVQGAINAAHNKDLILVNEGSYRENLDFSGKEIVVRSLNGPDYTTINGTRRTNNKGGAVWCKDSSRVEIYRSRISSNNAADFGGAFFIYGSTVGVVQANVPAPSRSERFRALTQKQQQRRGALLKGRPKNSEY